MIVVDTNVIAYYYLNAESSEQSEDVFKKDPIWVAPILWRSEFRSVLTKYLRTELLDLETAQQIMAEAEIMFKQNEYTVASSQVLQLASSSRLSAYDCEFVALALNLNVPLITADQRIQQAFPQNTLSLDAFLLA